MRFQFSRRSLGSRGTVANLVLFNKPFNVLCQFTDDDGRATLANFLDIPDVYPAGRLDYDSEGLVLLTDDGQLQHRIADPAHKLPKTYWVQVEGEIEDSALDALRRGVLLNDGPCKPAKVKVIEAPPLWLRNPPVRSRKNIVDSWLELEIREGRNRQVRRMTAAIGHPTLRLVRVAIGPWRIDQLLPGEFRTEQIHLPQVRTTKHRVPQQGKRRPRSAK